MCGVKHAVKERNKKPSYFYAKLNQFRDPLDKCAGEISLKVANIIK